RLIPVLHSCRRDSPPCLISLRQKLVPALLRGGEQLRELRGTAQRCQSGIFLHRFIGAVVALDRRLQRVQGRFRFSAPTHVCSKEVAIFRIGIGQPSRFSLANGLLRLRGGRFSRLG